MIKDIYNKLFHSNKSTNENKEQYSNCNAIVFILDPKNKEDIVDIKLYINDTSDESAKQFGTLLYSINESFYAKSFLQMMSDITKDNPEYSTFMNIAIKRWSDFFHNVKNQETTEDQNSDDPIVPPSYFYSK